ncbi:MAG: hypothetical protein HY735_20475 [Verrucomicrobia bacterium]|nr:hypothetical protein [Verrucomicrobiota bacterium]
MKTQSKRISRNRRLFAQFGPDVEFDLTPSPAIVPSETVRIRFQELQERLVRDSLSGTQNPVVRGGLQIAAHEAAALAWTTPYPLLVMPILFQEKARSFRLRLAKQHRVSAQTRRLTTELIEPTENRGAT